MTRQVGAPWAFGIVQPTSDPVYEGMWRRLLTDSFRGKYGLRTVEKEATAPCNDAANNHTCSCYNAQPVDACAWNGPSWPYETSRVLMGLGRLLGHHATPVASSREGGGGGSGGGGVDGGGDGAIDGSLPSDGFPSSSSSSSSSSQHHTLLPSWKGGGGYTAAQRRASGVTPKDFQSLLLQYARQHTRGEVGASYVCGGHDAESESDDNTVEDDTAVLLFFKSTTL